jgi:predicted nucleic acid-binding protein
MDRLRVTGEYTAEEVLQARERYLKFTVGMDFIPINRRILRRAADSFPVPLGTLDAIHLASAMAWRDRYEQEPVFATHDKALAKAAVTMGFLVVGV